MSCDRDKFYFAAHCEFKCLPIRQITHVVALKQEKLLSYETQPFNINFLLEDIPSHKTSILSEQIFFIFLTFESVQILGTVIICES